MAVSNTEAEKTQDKPGIYYSTKKQGSAKKNYTYWCVYIKFTQEPTEIVCSDQSWGNETTK